MFYTVHRRVVFVESFFLFQIMWGFSKGCQGQQQQPEEQKNTKESKRRRRRRLRQGLSATDVKKIVSEVQKIGLLGVAMWNLNSRCGAAASVNIAPQDSSDQLESSYFAALSQHVWGETRK